MGILLDLVLWEERERMKLDDSAERIFDIIRAFSKYCARCAKPLDLNYTDWHLPFCKKCRSDITEMQRKIVDEDAMIMRCGHKGKYWSSEWKACMKCVKVVHNNKDCLEAVKKAKRGSTIIFKEE